MADLSELGLTTYEDQAYRTLLGLGATTAKTVATESGVPEGRIYDVLSTLETRGMIRSQEASRPKRYLAVEPEVAVERLAEGKIRELEGQIDRYESIASQASEELGSETAVEERFWTTAIGTVDSLELLFERIDAADSDVVMVADAVPSPLDLDEVGPDLLDRLARAIERGVDVSLLVSENILAEIPHTLFDRASSGPFDAKQFSVRTTETLHGSLYLIDGDELCFPVVSPIERDRVLGLINLKDPTFALELEEQFRMLWESSTIVDAHVD
ncbi:TrmB family transcriptional regulator [Halodesulfurarchaeum sp.]|uniref:TrmB family transcriptional regulator n=1 Tax=Halodesulfurarchaeum sp. TaxID=1980530 RepID=UPI002FC28AEC